MFALAVIPPIILLIYIYKKDAKEKEPFKLLLSCFIWGAISAFPSLIAEELLSFFLDIAATPGSFFYGIFDGFIVAALSEEFFKYTFFKLKTNKSKEYNCMFDGIVYSVFVSLGFATFENILYVFDGGVSTGLLRMFTAIPGHACFAVYMGYFYSKARYASVRGDIKLSKKYHALALFIPVILHGTYDALLSFDEEIVGEGFNTMAILLWLCFIIVIYVFSFIFVNKASASDEYIESSYCNGIPNMKIVTYPKWKCSCGTDNTGNYCTNCGSPRP